jgi:hypothetical protein
VTPYRSPHRRELSYRGDKFIIPNPFRVGDILQAVQMVFMFIEYGILVG